MPLTPGTRLGPCQILTPIGAGGMGEVFRARDLRLERDVALKVLPEAFAHDAERLRRFRQEARAAGSLNHPNIVAVYDIGESDGATYVITELLEGGTLRDRLTGARFRRAKRSNMRCRWREVWLRPTLRASRIATSSPRISSSPATASSRF